MVSIYLDKIPLVQKIVNVLDAINEYAGRLCSWATLFMVVLICIEVILRYVFSKSIIWMVELEIYFFAASFLLASGYALKYDKHVRVDVFYTTWSERKKAWTNLFGCIFFLIPWCVIAILGSYKYALISWRIGEVSQQPGGLPSVYLLKSIVVIGFLLLLLQAISLSLKSILTINSKLKVEAS